MNSATIESVLSDTLGLEYPWLKAHSGRVEVRESLDGKVIATLFWIVDKCHFFHQIFLVFRSELPETAEDIYEFLMPKWESTLRSVAVHVVKHIEESMLALLEWEQELELKAGKDYPDE